MAKSPVITVGRSLPQHVWGLVKDVVPPMHAAGRPFVAGALTLGEFGWPVRVGTTDVSGRGRHTRAVLPCAEARPADLCRRRGRAC